MNDRLTVAVDPELSDLIPNFLARKRADARVIASAVERSEFASVASLAHRLKGEGGSYGFPAISAMGAALESAAHARDRASARSVAMQILAYLERVEVIYRSPEG